MDRNRQLLLNTMYSLVGNLGARVVSFLMIPLYTIWLSPSDYGLVDLIQTYNEVLLMIVGLGIAESLVVFPVGKEDSEKTAILSTALIFHLLFVIIFAIVFVIFDNTQISWLSSISPVLWYAYAMLMANSSSRILIYFCRGNNQMKVFSFTGVISAFCTAGLSFLLIPGMGVRGYLIALISSNFISALFIFFYAKIWRYINFNYFSKSELIEMLKFSIPLIPNTVLWWLILGLNKPLLESHYGVAAIGIMAIANKIPYLMQMFYGFFDQSWMLTAITEFDKSDFNYYFNRVLKTLMSFQCYVCVLLSFWGGWFLTTIVNNRYEEAGVYVPIMCLSIVFSNLSSFCTSIFSAIKKTYLTFYSVALATIVSLILNFLLIPSMSIWGACVSILCAYIVASLSRMYFSRKYVQFTNLKEICTNIGFCVVSIVIVYFVEDVVLKLLFFIILSIIYYIYNRDDIGLILSRISVKFKKDNR